MNDTTMADFNPSKGLSNSAADSCCRVCGAQPAGKHFGSICCIGCKSFFRRSVRQKMDYACVERNECRIVKEYRNSCRACRLRRCYAVGMDPLLVQQQGGVDLHLHHHFQHHPNNRSSNVMEWEETGETTGDGGSPPPSKRTKLPYLYEEFSSSLQGGPLDKQHLVDSVRRRGRGEQPSFPYPSSTSTDPLQHRILQRDQRLLMASSRKALEVSSTLALGCLSGLTCPTFTDLDINYHLNPPFSSASSGSGGGFFSTNTTTTLAHYFLRVERFCDSYHDSDASHVDPYHLPACNLHIPLEQALVEPGAVIARTPIDWSAQRYLAAEVFPVEWARCVCYYIDWASHIPELRQLDSGDMVRMLASRLAVCIPFIFAHRSISVAGGEVMLFSGGSYFPRCGGEAGHNPSLYAFFRELCRIFFEEVFPAAVEMGVSDGELALLKVLCFCIPPSGLSPRGKALIHGAHDRYLSALITEVMGRYSRLASSTSIVPPSQNTQNTQNTNSVEAASASELLLQPGSSSSSSSHRSQIALPPQSGVQVDAALVRLGKMMGWLSAMERAGLLSDTHIAMLALFNMQMRETLPYEVHVRAAQWK